MHFGSVMRRTSEDRLQLMSNGVECGQPNFGLPSNAQGKCSSCVSFSVTFFLNSAPACSFYGLHPAHPQRFWEVFFLLSFRVLV